MSEPTILYDVTEGVATLTLNRPDRLNAMTAAMGAAFNEAVRRADADPTVVVVVLTGAGRGFCAGAELDVVDAISGGAAPTEDEAGMEPHLLQFLRKPVIAAVNGPAAGAGMALLAYADIRVIAEEAVLTTRFPQLGLAAEYGLSWTLPRLVGRGRAADLLLSGRKVTGAEAGRIGLAEMVVPAEQVHATARSYALEIAKNCAPRSLATIKGQLNADQEHGHETAARRAAALMEESFVSADLAEAMAARAERRDPLFDGLDQR